MSEKIDIWEKIDSKQIADCRVFKVREDFSVNSETGQNASFFVIENPDWVNIIALTKENEVVLIEQFRHGTENVILEIPGGLIDENEEAVAAAKRELLEETGFSSEEMIYLGESHPNPAIQSNTLYHFLALDCEKTNEPNFDDHESVATRIVDLKEVPKLIAEGRITHSLAITSFYYLSLYQMKKE